MNDATPINVVVDPQPAQNKPQPIDFTTEIVTLLGTKGPFQTHAITALIACGLSLIIWLFVGIGATWFPWFIYPVTLFLMSMSAHYFVFIHQKEWFKAHCFWFIVLNCMFLTTWLACNTFSVFPMYTFLVFSAALAIHYVVVNYRENPHLYLYCHAIVSTILNALLFVIYLDTRGSCLFQWFIFPLFGFAFLLLFHACYHCKISLFTTHVYSYILGQIFFFATWEITGIWIMPWFLIIMVIWAIGLYAHLYVIRKRAAKAAPVTVLPVMQPPFGLDQSQPQASPAAATTFVPQQLYTPQQVVVMPSPAQPQQPLYPQVQVPQL